MKTVDGQKQCLPEYVKTMLSESPMPAKIEVPICSAKLDQKRMDCVSW